jgi:hypothetical protein
LWLFEKANESNDLLNTSLVYAPSFHKFGSVELKISHPVNYEQLNMGMALQPVSSSGQLNFPLQDLLIFLPRL